MIKVGEEGKSKELNGIERLINQHSLHRHLLHREFALCLEVDAEEHGEVPGESLSQRTEYCQICPKRKYSTKSGDFLRFFAYLCHAIDVF